MAYKRSGGLIKIGTKFQKAGRLTFVDSKREKIMRRDWRGKSHVSLGEEIRTTVHELFTQKSGLKDSFGDVKVQRNAIANYSKALEKRMMRIIQGILFQEQERVMAVGYEAYKRVGLEEKELTGNTRASIRSYIVTSMKSAKQGRLMGLKDTPKPKYNVLRPGQLSVAGGGEPESSMESPSRHRYESNIGKRWRYYHIELYKHAGEWRKIYADKLQDTGIIGKADVDSDMRLHKAAIQMLRSVKSNKETMYFIGVTAMSNAYVQGLDVVIKEMDDYLYDAVHGRIESEMGKSGAILQAVNEYIASVTSGRSQFNTENKTVKFADANTNTQQ